MIISPHKSAHQAKAGRARHYVGSGFGVITHVDQPRRESTVGPDRRWRCMAIAAALIATFLGLWMLAMVSATHDYPLPPTSTFGNLRSEQSLNHR
jgi:hypothetical protein